MKLSKFKYKLPPELIALHPTPNRDEARLMVLDRKTGKIVETNCFLQKRREYGIAKI